MNMKNLIKKYAKIKNVWINSAMINNMKNSIFKENKKFVSKRGGH